MKLLAMRPADRKSPGRRPKPVPDWVKVLTAFGGLVVILWLIIAAQT